MDAQGWGIEMARYNEWQNEKLYGICREIGQEAREQDRGMFFRSIRLTLDHILMVDDLLFRLADSGEAPTVFEPGKPFCADWSMLCDARRDFDAAVEARFGEVDADWFAETVTFTRPAANRRTSLPRQFLLMQMFNHATHHRSQVTSELHRMGVDYGNTDLPYNPNSTM
ncbi:MAG: DinB family protein [Minwuia sp.]|uniref:DinB family protein n=1 Tax=Minwuia sp. TaxID=2493630 RepID=UPI003A89714D